LTYPFPKGYYKCISKDLYITQGMAEVQPSIEEQAAVFGMLADPTRLKLVKLLCYQHESGALCVNALADILGVTQSAVSQHLRVLKAVGLVKGERRGCHMHYFVNQDMLQEFRQLTLGALSVDESSYEQLCHKSCLERREDNVS